MTAEPESLSFGEPRPARVADLEAELSSLWRSMSEGERGEHALTRACALTLLVYSEGARAQNEIAAVVAAITPQNPCRAILMLAEPESKQATLEAWVSAHCHLPVAGEKQVCCEQVTVGARGEAVRDLDNIVVPLTAPGLPVYLWWRAGRFAPAPYFENILRVTERVIVDSARFREPRADFDALANEIRNREGSLSVSDLNWARGAGWREAVAQCFDPPEARPLLVRIREVEILSSEERGPSQALLLSGWLAARLNWKAQRAKEDGVLEFATLTGTVRVRLSSEKKSTTVTTGISQIVFRTNSNARAEFHLAAGPSGACVRLKPGRGADRSVVMPPAGESDLLNRELQRAGRDRIFEESLALIATL
jgi:glucose-6-phosphate dehydrogenase assembly protein OpcA